MVGIKKNSDGIFKEEKEMYLWVYMRNYTGIFRSSWEVFE